MCTGGLAQTTRCGTHWPYAASRPGCCMSLRLPGSVWGGVVRLGVGFGGLGKEGDER